MHWRLGISVAKKSATENRNIVCEGATERNHEATERIDDY